MEALIEDISRNIDIFAHTHDHKKICLHISKVKYACIGHIKLWVCPYTHRTHFTMRRLSESFRCGIDGGTEVIVMGVVMTTFSYSSTEYLWSVWRSRTSIIGCRGRIVYVCNNHMNTMIFSVKIGKHMLVEFVYTCTEMFHEIVILMCLYMLMSI